MRTSQSTIDFLLDQLSTLPGIRARKMFGDYAEEAAFYRRLFEAHCRKTPRSLLDLGAGGGHNAAHLKSTLTCTLVDVSPDMLALSRRLNPECEHVRGCSPEPSGWSSLPMPVSGRSRSRSSTAPTVTAATRCFSGCGLTPSRGV